MTMRAINLDGAIKAPRMDVPGQATQSTTPISIGPGGNLVLYGTNIKHLLDRVSVSVHGDLSDEDGCIYRIELSLSVSSKDITWE